MAVEGMLERSKMTQEPSESASPPTLFTIPQVAAYLGVCRAHVYRLIADGLPVIRLGRLVRINTQSLQDWLQEQEHHPRTS
jgi:excisionase family DNA binding protein